MKIGAIMSAIETTRSQAVGGLGAVLGSLLSLVVSWQEARVVRRDLGRLSDRELDDIGLCRGDIERIARRF